MGFEITNRAMVGLGAAIGTAAVLLTYPGGLSSAYRDATTPPPAALAAAAERLNSAQIMDRIALKEAMVNELIAGRAGLVEVAGRFEALNGVVPGSLEVLRTRYPGLSDLERAAMNVLDYVDGQELPAEQLRPIMRRLAGDYRLAFGRDAGAYGRY